MPVCSIDISVPTDGLEDPAQIAQSTLKEAVVTLPEGMTVNPASAGGIDDVHSGSEGTALDGTRYADWN